MIIIDSSGWIEYFADGPNRAKFEAYIAGGEEIITPTIVLAEVFKKIIRDAGKTEALTAAAYLQTTKVVPLTEAIAFTAAELGLEHSLHLADSIIYATASEYGCKVVTSDAHFENLPNVVCIKK